MLILYLPTAASAASLDDLGLLPGGSSSQASAINTNGSVVVGSGNNSGINEAFRWTQADGMVGLGFLPGGNSSDASGVNADGSVVVGSGAGSSSAGEAFRWTQGTGMVGLGFLPSGSFSNATAVNTDGSVIVGYGNSSNSFTSEAFRWTQGAGLAGLGFLPGSINSASYAYGVNADGTVVVGQSGNSSGFTEAFRWTQGTGMVGLGFLQGGSLFSSATAVSADGSAVAGFSFNASFHQEAFRWTQGTGMVGLGFLPGGSSSNAAGINVDGSVVVGYGNSSSSAQEAFRWTQGTGMQSVLGLLTAEGVNVSNWSLTNANGVSANGNIIIGTATHNGNSTAYIANIATGGTSTGGTTTPPGLITPEALVQSLAGVAAVPAQGQAMMSGHNSQSLFVARNAMSSYFASPSYLSMSDADLPDLALAAGGDSYLPRIEHRDALYAVGSFGFGNDTRNYSGNTGALFRLTDDVVIGGGAIGSRTDQDTQLGGNSRINAVGGAAMMAYEPQGDGIRLYGTASATKLDVDTTRNYMNGGDIDGSRGKTDGTGYGVIGRAGYSVGLDRKTSIMPYAEMEWSQVNLDGYTEQGGPFPATVSSKTSNSTISRLGAELSYAVNPALTLRGNGAWGHSLSGNDNDVQVNAATLSFTLPQGKEDKNWAEGGIGGIYKATERTTLSADLDARTGDTSQPAVNLMLGVNVAF
jgi:probable HAF family extracellular repeat protein